MIITSRMMIRNAQSGAAGNQTICATAFMETKKTAAQRAAALRANSPTPVMATSEPRIRYTQPQVVALEMITPLPPTITFLSSRIAASPQNASSEPTINRTMPAKTAQSDGSLCLTDLDVSISFLLAVLVGNAKNTRLRTSRPGVCSLPEGRLSAPGPEPPSVETLRPIAPPNVAQ